MTVTIKKYHREIIGGLLCLALGILSGYVGSADSVWYLSLNKPVFNPPGWIFGPVWTILYLMMGAALGMLWQDRMQNRRLIIIFVIQFILNLLWSPIFFYYKSIGLALLDICALWLSIAWFMFAARKQKTILILFFPYMVWVSFATVLNFSLYQINSI